jgi:ribosomal protein S14
VTTKTTFGRLGKPPRNKFSVKDGVTRCRACGTKCYFGFGLTEHLRLNRQCLSYFLDELEYREWGAYKTKVIDGSWYAESVVSNPKTKPWSVFGWTTTGNRFLWRSKLTKLLAKELLQKLADKNYKDW